MSKEIIKKRIILVKEHNIAEIQNILEEEALKGWYYNGKKGPIFYFKKGQAKKLKFRLLPSSEKLSEKEINRYKKAGWDYIGDLDRTAIFAGKISVDEIKVEKNINDNIIEKMKSEIFYQFLLLFGIFVLALISIIAVNFSNGYIWKNVADFWNANFSIPLIFLTLIIFASNMLIDKIKYLKSFIKLPIESNGNVKKKTVYSIINSTLVVVLSILSVVAFIFTFQSMINGVNSKDCLKYKGKNMIQLMDVEEKNEFYTQEQYDKLGITKNVNVTPIYSGTYSIAKTLVCNEHMTWNEKLYNDVGKYSAELVGEYYDLKDKKVAKKIYKEIVNKVIANDKKEGIQGTKISRKKLKEYGFDEKYVMKYGRAYTVVIREKNIIYYIEFSGNKSYENVLKQIKNSFAGRKIFGG